MTQPTQEGAVGDANTVVDAAETPTIEDRFAAFDSEGEEPPAEDPQDAPEAQADDADDPEADLTADDIADDDTEVEAELPPIDAPVSWSAEEKEAFKALPREMQETVTRREGEREKFVQTKAQEAARAKQEAERAALSRVAEIERAAIEQINQFAPKLPAKPDPRLLNSSEEHRAYYYQQLAAYEEAAAQHEQVQQAATERGQRLAQYEQEMERQEAEAFRQSLAEQLPEYLDPSTGPKLQQELGSIALELGYSAEQIAEARAADILAMKKASDWKAKAAKYDTLMAKKMEKVREAKQLPKVARPGVAQPKGAADNARYQADRQAMRRGDQDAAVRAFSRFI